MDSFNMSNIKFEKANALKKHRQLQKIASLFRLVEICLVLALISRFSVQLPVAVRNSSGYFKDLSVILVSHRFVFVLGNAIVIILFAKSGQFSSQDPSGRNSSRTDIYEEFVEKSEKSQSMHMHEVENRGEQSTCVEYIVTENTRTSLSTNNYQRSQSEKLNRTNCNKSGRELTLSATEKCLKSDDSSKELVENSYPEDKMSSEEFRCTIEAFIARQKRFRRDEENSIF